MADLVACFNVPEEANHVNLSTRINMLKMSLYNTSAMEKDHEEFRIKLPLTIFFDVLVGSRFNIIHEETNQTI